MGREGMCVGRRIDCVCGPGLVFVSDSLASTVWSRLVSSRRQQDHTVLQVLYPAGVW